MPKHSAEILKAIADLTAEVASLRALLQERKPEKKAKKVKDPLAPKKEPNAWLRFTSRVHTLLQEHPEMALKRTVEIQFASSLKAKKALDEWADGEILAERATWVAPPAKEKAKKAAAPAASAASADNSADSDSDSASNQPKKRRGPKKLSEMTPEELATHKAKVAERKGKSKKEKVAAAAAVPLPASGSASEAEDEDEETIILVKKVIQGKKYIFNPKTNYIYADDHGSAGEFLGVFDGTSGKIVPAEE